MTNMYEQEIDNIVQQVSFCMIETTPNEIYDRVAALNIPMVCKTIYKHGLIADKEITLLNKYKFKYVSYNTYLTLEPWNTKINMSNFLFNSITISKIYTSTLHSILNIPKPSGTSKLPTVKIITTHNQHILKYKCNSREAFKNLNNLKRAAKNYIDFVLNQQNTTHAITYNIKENTLLNLCLQPNLNAEETIDKLYIQQISIRSIIELCDKKNFRHKLKLLHPSTIFTGHN